MNDDILVTRALRRLSDDDEPGLDPVAVLVGVKRRRSRNLAIMAGASVAVASVAVAGLMTAGSGNRQPPVAGGDPTGIASTGSSVAATSSTPRPGVVPSTKFTQPVPKARTNWTPGGPIGARTVGTIPSTGQVEIAPKYWVETRGTKWCISEADDSPSGRSEPFGCRATIGNKNLGDDRTPGVQFSSDAKGNKVVTSVFRGDARRVIYTDGDKFYEAKLYRLTAVPGWMLSVAVYKHRQASTVLPRTDADICVFVYDAAGKLLSQFPSAKAGGPTTNPLK